MAASKSETAPTATWVTTVGGNDTTWRAGWPAEAIGGRVLRVPNGLATEAFGSPNTHTEFPWSIRATDERGQNYLLRTKEEWDLFTAAEHPGKMGLQTEFPTLNGEPIVFVRPGPARRILGQTLRYRGVRTLAETDDNYFANEEQNIFSRLQGGSVDLHQQHAVAMASMQGIVFSTKWLRDRYLKEFTKRFHVKGIEKRRWMPETFVCRNHMPSWAWPSDEDGYDGPLRFGFMGSPSHVWDLGRLAYASFHAAHTLGCRTVFIGYNPADPDPDVPDFVTVDGEEVPTRTEESLAVSRKWQSVVDEHVRWVDPLVFKRGGLPLDIALCPLLWNDFNMGRSDIKCIEAVVAGAAPVCSASPVFSAGGWKNEVNCLMGGSQEELAKQVVRLVKDPILRRDLVEAGREMVRNERDERALQREWGEALGL